MRLSKLALLPLIAAFALQWDVVSAGAQMYHPKIILFTGAVGYKAADLIAVTGLTVGKPVSSAEIDTAMQHLVDTGLFSDMRYTVDDKELTFALTPIAADQLLPVRYKNFVWWNAAELTPLIHAQIPLFTGKVPVTGTMKDEVTKQLEALVLGKGVKAEVSSITSSEGPGGSSIGLVFFISQPTVEIGEVRIDQVSGTAAPKVSEIKRRFVGQDYDVTATAPALNTNLREAYLDLGYLDITVDPLVHGAPQVSAMAITVDISTAVHEGAVYHVSQMVWPEPSPVSKATLAEAVPLKPGDPASRIELLSTIARATGRFEAVGYLDAKVTVDAKKDDARHEMEYTFAVAPGEVYKVGSVNTSALSAEQLAEFNKIWKLAPGDVYNGDFALMFLKKSASIKAFQGYTPRFNRVGDPKTHLVTITVSLVRGTLRPS